MKALLLGAGALALAGCTVHIDHDPKTGDIAAFYLTPTKLGGVMGNGIAKTETRSLATFNVIDARGAVDVDVREGETQSVVVSGDSNLLALIETRLEGNTLHIQDTGSFNTRNPLKVIVTTPSLSRITHDGSGDLRVSGLHVDTLNVSQQGPGDAYLDGKVGQLTLSSGGSGNVQMANLQLDDLTLSMTGPGDIHLTGQLQRLDASVNGSGDLQLDGLNGPATIEVNGPGGAVIGGNVSALNAHVNGSGDLQVSGLTGGDAMVTSTGPGDVKLSGKAGKLKLILTGSGDVQAEGLSMANVDAQMAGPGDATLGSVMGEHFDATLSGSGSLHASGHAKVLTLAVNGPGDASLSTLAVDDATVSGSGSGDIAVQVNANLVADSHGPGEITVTGHPAVRSVRGSHITMAG
jgi:hypothetical protein